MKALKAIKAAAFALMICGAQNSYASFNKGNATLNPNDINFLKSFLMQKSADGTMENYKVLGIKKNQLDSPEKWECSGDEGVDRNFAFVWKKDKNNVYQLIRIQFNKSDANIANLGGEINIPAPAGAIAVINLEKCEGITAFNLTDAVNWNKRQIYGLTIIDTQIKKIDVSAVAKSKGSLIGGGIKKNNNLTEVKFSPFNLKDEGNVASISENPKLYSIEGTVNFKEGGFFDIKKNALPYSQIAKITLNNAEKATRITVGPQTDFILGEYYNEAADKHEVKSGTVIDLTKELNVTWRGMQHTIEATWYKLDGKKKNLIDLKQVEPGKYEITGNAGDAYVLRLSCPTFFEGLSCGGKFSKMDSREFVIK